MAEWQKLRRQVEQQLREAAPSGGEPAAVMVGDLSGIQQFIYAVADPLSTAGRMAVRLRARSVQLSALCLSFCRHLCHQQALREVSVLSVSGGNFMLVLPAAAATPAAVEAFREQAEAWLWTRTWGELALSVGVSQPVGDLVTGGWEAVQEAYADLQAQRLRPWRRAVSSTLALPGGGAYQPPLFAAAHHDAECPSCRRLPVAAGGTLCRMCQVQTDWARRIVRVHGSGAAAIKVVDAGGAGDLEVFAGYVVPAEAGETGTVGLCTYAPTFADLGVPPPGGEDPQGTATFEALAACATGAQKLAVLAVDADNMGWVMSRRYGGLSDSLALSRLLGDFFGPELIRDFVARAPQCYLLYAGGDDVLLAGPWDRVLALAESLQRRFQEVFGPVAQALGLPSPLTISAGIAVDGPSTPIADLAHRAHAALEAAKEAGTPRGDRVQVGGVGCSWESYAALLAVGRDLHQRTLLPRTSPDHVSRSFVHQLYRVMDLCDQWLVGGQPEGLRYKALLHAAMARHRLPAAVRASLEQHLMAAGSETAGAFRLALDWASLAGRASGDE